MVSGRHCLIREGYGFIADKLAEPLNVKLNHRVTAIECHFEDRKHEKPGGVQVHCRRLNDDEVQ